MKEKPGKIYFSSNVSTFYDPFYLNLGKEKKEGLFYRSTRVFTVPEQHERKENCFGWKLLGVNFQRCKIEELSNTQHGCKGNEAHERIPSRSKVYSLRRTDLLRAGLSPAAVATPFSLSHSLCHVKTVFVIASRQPRKYSDLITFR